MALPHWSKGPVGHPAEQRLPGSGSSHLPRSMNGHAPGSPEGVVPIRQSPASTSQGLSRADFQRKLRELDQQFVANRVPPNIERWIAEVDDSFRCNSGSQKTLKKERPMHTCPETAFPKQQNYAGVNEVIHREVSSLTAGISRLRLGNDEEVFGQGPDAPWKSKRRS